MTLDEICRHYGIRTSYEATGPVPDSTKQALLTALGADPGHLPEPPADGPVTAPEGVACYCPPWVMEQPAWGLFCQLYELRSDRNWGIGDFGDLAEISRIAAAAGASFLGVNPVHALFPAAPMRRSPFMPSNRRFLNPLYIAMDDLPSSAPEDAEALAALRASDLIDYDVVTAVKYAALRSVFDAGPVDGARFSQAAFDAFVADGGAALRDHALFDALSLHLTARGHAAGWTSWPEAYVDHDGPAVREFAQTHAEEVRFHLWLQWIASVQLSDAQAAARAAGMRIGIYLDLAVGEAPDGSATWSAREALLDALTVGAPPDVFSQAGQTWDLAAPSPLAMAANDYDLVRELLRAQLRYAGALRIDHAMALWQLFLIPKGEPASAGTHLRYPFADLMRVLAEESEAAGAIVIGEDLGYVPPGFRDAMQATRMMGYRIFYFEQEWGLFRRSETYPTMAMACLSTHDLPTLAHWWQGADIAHRRTFGLISADAAAADAAQRREERRALIGALHDDGQSDITSEHAEAEELPPRILVAVHRFLAGTPCVLTAVRLADLIGPVEATNVPGTTNQYPNWQKRAPIPVSGIAGTPAFEEVTAAMRELRPSRPEPH